MLAYVVLYVYVSELMWSDGPNLVAPQCITTTAASKFSKDMCVIPTPGMMETQRGSPRAMENESGREEHLRRELLGDPSRRDCFPKMSVAEVGRDVFVIQRL
jgi:hypothetical protein